jgi:hypothetical protein
MICGAKCRGLVCTRKRGHGGVFHVARGMWGRLLLKWRIAPRGGPANHNP